MKRLSVFVSVCTYLSCASWLLAGCGGGDGTLDSCVSSYTGTFTGMGNSGPSNGRILATMRGNFINSMGEEAGPLLTYRFVFDTKPDPDGAPNVSTGSQALMPDGTLVMASSGLVLTGSIDFDTCEGSGTWEGNAFLGSGEWRIALPDVAF